MATGSEKRQRRSEARENRRSLTAKPFEELDEAAGAEESADGTSGMLRKAATTAAAGAVAAGIAGAVRALADRHEHEQPEAEPSPQPEAEPSAQAEAAPAPEPEGEPEPEEAEPEEAEPQQEEQRDEPSAEADNEPPAGPVRGASPDEVKELVDEARGKLKELLGLEPEAVSGFSRSNGRSTVTLEVVTVHRVPETTDVLSSYEVVFDDDRNLVSLNETRRYRRSQVEEGR